MRILHINPGNLYGGIEKILTILAKRRYLCPEMQSEFAICFPGKFQEELESLGIVLYRLGSVRGRYPWTVWQARKNLSKLLRSQNFSAVCCHSTWSVAIFGKVVKSLKIPLIFWQHDAVSAKKLHRLERWAASIIPDQIICNSKFTQSTLPRLYPHASSEVFYCPIPEPTQYLSSEELYQFRADQNIKSDEIVITMIARWESCKGHDNLIDSLAQLSDNPYWQCWLVGGCQRPKEQEYQNSILAKAKQYGIRDRIHLLGHRSDIDRILQASDIFCQPNQSPDTFGIVFVEALYNGLPVITTAMGGPEEILTSNCGYLVQPGNIPQLTRILRQLIDSKESRARFGLAGKQRARELCLPESQIKKLHDLISQSIRVPLSSL